jgi:hypothetical protein
LGFLPWSVEGVSKVREQDTAYGLVDGVQVELERMGFTLVEAGTTRLAQMYSAILPPGLSDTNLDLLLVSRREGGMVSFEQVIESSENRVKEGDETEGPNQLKVDKEMGGVVWFNKTQENDPKPVSLYGYDENHQETFPYSHRWIPEEERYFLIKCSQFPLDHRHQHHPSNGFLSLQVDIQWPYKVPDPSRDSGFRRIPMKFRNHFRLPMAIVR